MPGARGLEPPAGAIGWGKIKDHHGIQERGKSHSCYAKQYTRSPHTVAGTDPAASAEYRPLAVGIDVALRRPGVSNKLCTPRAGAAL